jgi:hypothetical protein
MGEPSQWARLHPPSDAPPLPMAAAEGILCGRYTGPLKSARSSGDRALPCGGRGRMFESCRAHPRGYYSPAFSAVIRSYDADRCTRGIRPSFAAWIKDA